MRGQWGIVQFSNVCAHIIDKQLGRSSSADNYGQILVQVPLE